MDTHTQTSVAQSGYRSFSQAPVVVGGVWRKETQVESGSTGGRFVN